MGSKIGKQRLGSEETNQVSFTRILQLGAFPPSSSSDGLGFFVTCDQSPRRSRFMATVLVPTPLRRLTGGQSKLTVAGSDVGSLIHAVDAQYPGVAAKVFDSDGNVKRFIHIFLNDDEIRTLQGLATPVRDDDKVSIVPAMAGGV
jgi:molybdopterin converting factor small subunit